MLLTFNRRHFIRLHLLQHDHCGIIACSVETDFGSLARRIHEAIAIQGSSLKVAYDKDANAVYIQLSLQQPEGVIEVADGINIDVSSDGKIVGIELLNATEKVSLESLLSYEISAETLREWAQSKGDVATRVPS